MTQNPDRDFEAEFRGSIPLDVPGEDAWDALSPQPAPVVNDPGVQSVIDSAAIEHAKAQEQQQKRTRDSYAVEALNEITRQVQEQGSPLLGGFGVASPENRQSVLQGRKADADAAQKELEDRKALYDRLKSGPRDSTLSKVFGAINDFLPDIPDPLSIIAPGSPPLHSGDFAEWDDSIERMQKGIELALSNPEIDVADDSAAGWVRSRTDSLVSSFVSVPAALVETTGHYARVAGWHPGTVDKPEPNAVEATGRWIKAQAQTLFPTDPSVQEEFSMKVAAGIGSMAGFMGGGQVALAARLGQKGQLITIALMGGALSADEAVESVRESKDYTDSQILLGLTAASVIGISEALPIVKNIPGMTPATKSKIVTYALLMFREGIEEWGQETFQTIMQNALARFGDPVFSGVEGWDKDRRVLEGVGEAGAVGFIVGALAQGARLSASKATREAALAEARAGLIPGIDPESQFYRGDGTASTSQPLIREARARSGSSGTMTDAPGVDLDPADARAVAPLQDGPGETGVRIPQRSEPKRFSKPELDAAAKAIEDLGKATGIISNEQQAAPVADILAPETVQPATPADAAVDGVSPDATNTIEAETYRAPADAPPPAPSDPLDSEPEGEADTFDPSDTDIEAIAEAEGIDLPALNADIETHLEESGIEADLSDAQVLEIARQVQAGADVESAVESVLTPPFDMAELTAAADVGRPEQWTPPVDGAPATASMEVVTPDGSMRVRATPQVVELDDITYASGAFQPRDRSRKESQSGVMGRATNLDPGRLRPDRVSDSGAPMLDRSGRIISGNGRVMSIEEVYRNPALKDRADAYRAMLGPQAQGMRRPVLVNRIDDELSDADLIRFADLSNRPATAALSAIERAQRDARAAGPEVMGLYTGGSFTSPENRPFYRGFLDRAVTEAERPSLSRDGLLTKEGQDRIAAAVLAAAYGDSDLLARMLESTDDNIRNVTGAMQDAAGAFIRLKQAIADGQASAQFDITPQIVETAKRIADLRERNIKPSTFLAQLDAFTQLDPVVESLLRGFYNDNLSRALSREKLADILTRYANEAAKHNDTGLIPDETSPEQIIAIARDRALGAEREAAGQTSFFGASGTGFARRDDDGRGPEAPRPADSESRTQTGGQSQSDVRQKFAEVLASKTPRAQWAGALGVDQATLQSLIDEALADGRMEMRFGKPVRTAKARVSPDRPRTAEPEAPTVAPRREAAPTLLRSEEKRLEAITDKKTYGHAANLFATRHDAEAFALARDALNSDKRIRNADLAAILKALTGRRAKPKNRKAAIDAIQSARDAWAAKQARTKSNADAGPLGKVERLLPEERLPETVRADEEGRPPESAPGEDRGGSARDGRGSAIRDDAQREPADGLPGPREGAGSDTGADPGDRERGTDTDAAAGSDSRPVGPTPEQIAALEADRAAELEEREAERQDRVARNYIITDADKIGQGGAKTKVRNNLAAIRTIRKIEEENRLATDEEKAILVKYVGWGAFAQDVFADHKPEWKSERAELKSLLSADEYKSARASTLNAHYTSPEVIKGMWQALEHFGFKGGRALEPSAGVGHFIGLQPESMRADTAWTAVELDTISGRITEALYGAADVRIGGFQDQAWPDNFFDLAISNVPFAKEGPHDPAYKKRFSLHDYFFVKALDKVRPGGIVAFITSSYTLDKKRDATRLELEKRGTFIGAVRLPGGNKGAFKANAGTDVTTDIIFFRKRVEGEPTDTNAEWRTLETIKTPEGDTEINGYFAANPHMMLGKMRLQRSMYSKGEPVLIGPTEDLDARITEAVKTLPANQMLDNGASAVTFDDTVDSDTDGIKEGSFYEKEGTLYRKITGVGQPVKVNKQDEARIRAFMPMRDAVKALLASQASGQGADLTDLRKDLNKAYDAFVKQFGPVNKAIVSETKRKDGTTATMRRRPNFKPFMEDPDAYTVAAIELYDEKTGKAKKTAIFTEDILAPYQRPDVSTPADALAVSLNEKGGVDIPLIAELLNVSERQAIETLGDGIYLNPNGMKWETAARYLSGDVVTKLEDAEAAAKINPKFDRNVTALQDNQPTPLSRADITVQFGASWVPADIINEFIRERIGLRDAEIELNPLTKNWNIIRPGSPTSSAVAEWGTDAVGVLDIVKETINSKPIILSYKDKDGNVKRDVKAEEAARAKQTLMKEAFTGQIYPGALAAIGGWVWENDARAERIEAIYNRHHNRIVKEKHDGSHLTMPGLARTVSFPDGSTGTINLTPARVNTVWRVIQNGNTLIDHVVGAGKTWTSIMAVMEMKRLGQIRRPMFVVPNHMLYQFSHEFLQAYPGAKLLVATKDQMSKDKRAEFAAKAASDNWDGIIITHSAFGRLPMKPQAYKDYYEDQLLAAKDAYTNAKDRATVKDIERLITRVQNKLDKLSAKENKDTGITFEELGVDHLTVDEAHLFKNLWFQTRHTRVKGISNASESQRATDLFIKIRALEKTRPGRSALFLTGTPLSNTMAEVYTMMRYLQNDTLEEYGIAEFDSWAQTYGDIKSRTELAPNGRELRDTTTFGTFVNVPELATLYGRIADTQTAESLGLQRPAIKGGKPKIIEGELSESEESFITGLIDDMEAIKSKPPEKGAQNFLPLFIRGLQAATDMRLVDPSAPFNPKGKIAKGVENIFDIWKRGNADPAAPNKAQLVFLDMGVPQSKAKAKPKKGEPKSVEEDVESEIENIRARLADQDPDADGAETDVDAAEAEAMLAGKFNLYADIKERLIAKGVPKEQIAFIHDAKTDEQKAKLFDAVREGKVRVLIGSTSKMGVGTNVQKLLVALHHLDAQWRPADLEQRDGRIIRQGNKNSEVEIYRYITPGSFDSYRWQVLETKSNFIGQFRAGARGVRIAEDIDAPLPDASELKAAATGDPRIIEQAETDRLVKILSAQASAHMGVPARAKTELAHHRSRIGVLESQIKMLEQDEAKVVDLLGDNFRIELDLPNGKTRTTKSRKDAGESLRETILRLANSTYYTREVDFDFATLSGFRVAGTLTRTPDGLIVQPILKGARDYKSKSPFYITDDMPPVPLIGRWARLVSEVPEVAAAARIALQESERQIPSLEAKSVVTPFPKQDQLEAAQKKLLALNEALKPKKKQNDPSIAQGPPKDKPVTLVFAGSFNPIHVGHEIAIRNAAKFMEDKGYTVARTIIAPSPEKLLKDKLGERAYSLEDRAEMIRLQFGNDPAFPVSIEPALELQAMEGKAKRTHLANWAKGQFPDDTVAAVTGADAAPGSPPTFPSVYQGDPGTSHEGYYYVAMPRDEGDGMSSSTIRKALSEGKPVPEGMMTPEAEAYLRDMIAAQPDLVADAAPAPTVEQEDPDAPNFSLPEPPRTLPDGHPLLQPHWGDEKTDPPEFFDRSPEREALRSKIIEDRFAGKRPAMPGEQIAYVMGGGGASGKGTVLKGLREAGIVTDDFVELDPDSFKTGDPEKGWGGIPEYWQIDAEGDSRAAGVTHEESSMLNKRAVKRGIDGGYNLVLDQTLGNPKRGLQVIKMLQDAGYEVRLIGVTVAPETAVKRAVARAKGPERRYVPLDHLLAAHKGFSEGFESYAEMADYAILVDTDVTYKADALLVAEKKHGESLVVMGEQAYIEFGRKVGLNGKEDTLNDLRRTQGEVRTQRETRALAPPYIAGELARSLKTAERRRSATGPQDGSSVPSQRLIPPKNSDPVAWLRDIFMRYGVDADAYGQRDANSLEKTAKELVDGEASLFVRDGELVRRAEVVALDVVVDLPGGTRMRLVEDRQEMADGRVRRRNLPQAVSEKLLPGEDPASVVDRAMREELGVSAYRQDQDLVVEDAAPFKSPRYPGLVSEYRLHKGTVSIAKEQFKPEYQEVQKDKTNVFAWRYLGPTPSDAVAASMAGFVEPDAPADLGPYLKMSGMEGAKLGHARGLIDAALDRGEFERALFALDGNTSLTDQDVSDVAEAYLGEDVDGSREQVVDALRQAFDARVRDMELAELGGFDPQISGSNLVLDDAAIRTKLEQLALRLPDGARLEIRDVLRLAIGGMQSVRQIAELEGVTLNATDAFNLFDIDPQSARKIIAVSLAYGPDVALSTFTHEEIHLLRAMKLIDGKEWKVLSGLARRKPGKAEALRLIDAMVDNGKAAPGQADAMRAQAGKLTYRQIYRIDERYASLNLSEDKLVEEVVAHVAADWSDGYEFGSRVDRVMMKVRDFIEALGNLLRGAGFESVNSIFNSVWSGEVARRAGRDSDMFDDGWRAQLANVQERALDSLGYYSGALEAAKNLRQARGTPEQMLAMLKKEGAKDAEISATRLGEFLDGKQSITKDEIVRYLEENRVRLNEVHYSGEEVRYKHMTSDGLGSYTSRRVGGVEGSAGAAKWSAYSLDKNNPTYRETVLHLPEQQSSDPLVTRLEALSTERMNLAGWGRPENIARIREIDVEVARIDPDGAVSMRRINQQKTGNPDNFRSGHFPEPNITGHMMTSMVKHEGRATYLIDQIQSDWGQKLRDGGVRDEAKIDGLKKELKTLGGSIDGLTESPVWVAADEFFARIGERSPGETSYVDTLDVLRDVGNGRTDAEYSDAIKAEAIKLADAYKAENQRRGMVEAELATATASSPGNPLVNTTDQWVNTTLRRAIRQAAEADADYIAIPSGDTVLSYNPGDIDGMHGFYGSTVKGEFGIVPKNLRNLLRKIDKQSPDPVRVDKLETPTQGMKGQGFTVFPLTPKVKASVLSDGQPMFSLRDEPVTPGLDMSKEARMARAKEMGFDTENVLYHGSLGDIQEFSTPYKNSGLPRGMVALSDSPQVADSYTDPLGVPSRRGQEIDEELGKLYTDFDNPDRSQLIKQLREERLKESAGLTDDKGNVHPSDRAIYPLYVRLRNPLEIDADGRLWHGILRGPSGSLKNYRMGVKERRVYGEPDASGQRAPEEVIDINQLAAWAKENGHDGLRVKNVLDWGSDSGSVDTSKPATTTIVFDPRNIRSVNAAFDPANADSANLMASLRGDPSSQSETPDLDRAIARLKKSLGIEVSQSLFGVTIKAGNRSVRINPRSNIRGQFGRATGSVSVRRSRDIQAIAHEGGHSLELLLSDGMNRLKANRQYADELLAPIAPDLPPQQLTSDGFSGVDLDVYEQEVLAEAVKADAELRRLSTEVGLAKSEPRIVGRARYDEAAYRDAERQAGLTRAQLVRLVGLQRADALVDDVRQRAKEDVDDYVRQRFSAMAEPRPRRTTIPDGEALSEGFARWFEKYVMDRNGADNMAPKFFEAFEDLLEAEAPSILEGLHKVQQEYKAWTERASVEELSSDLVSQSAGNDWKTIASSAQSFSDNLAGKMATAYTNVIDDLSPIQSVVRRLLSVADRNGVVDREGRPISLKVAENPYKIARMFRGAYATGYTWLKDGLPEYGGSVVAYPGLQQALAKAFGDKRWNKTTYQVFGQFLISKRAIAEYDRLAEKADRITQIDNLVETGQEVWRRLSNEQSGERDVLERREAALVRANVLLQDRTRALSAARTAERRTQERIADLSAGINQALQDIDDGSDQARYERDRRRRSLQLAQRQARDARRDVSEIEAAVMDLETDVSILKAEVDQRRKRRDERADKIDRVTDAIDLMKREREKTAKRGASRPPTLESRDWHLDYIAKVEADPKYAPFTEAADIVYQFTHGLLTMRHKAGLISKDLYDELSERKGWYVPFMRDMSDAAPEQVFTANGGGKSWSAFKKFDGSDRAIINPLEVLSQDAYATAQHIALNEAVGTLAALANRAGPGSAAIAQILERTEDMANEPETWEHIRNIAVGMGIDEADAHMIVQRMEMNFQNADLQAIWSPATKGPIAPPTLPLWENGERKHVVITDPEFGEDAVNAMMGLGKEQMHWAMEAMGHPARWLQVGVTTHPTFMPRNLIRDIFDAWIKTGALPVVSQIRGARLLAGADGGEFLRQYTESGGILGGRNIAALTQKEQQADVLDLDPKALRPKSIALGAVAGGLIGTIAGGPVGGVVGAVAAGYGTRRGNLLRMVEAVESMTRLGVAAHSYKRALAHNPDLTEQEAMLEAAYVARDVFDWNRRGAKMLQIVRTITFLNAQIQGLDRAARALSGEGDRGAAVMRHLQTVYRKEHKVPLSRDEERDLGEAYKVYGRLVLYTAGLLGLYALYRDDDEYEDIRDQTKATHSWVPNFLGIDLRIPKAFEWAIPSNLIEAIWDKLEGRDPRMLERMAQSTAEVMVPPTVPQALNLLAAYSTNTDLRAIMPWLFGESIGEANRQVVPEYLKRLSPEQQFDAFTSQLSKDIAMAMVNAGVPDRLIPSPKMIDFTLRTGGYWGQDIAKAYQAGKEALGAPSGPAMRVTDAPVLGGFTGIAARQSKSVDEMFKLMRQSGGQLATAAATYRNLLDQSGQPEKADAFLSRLEPEERAYAILKYHFPTADQRRHPLERLSSVAKITRDIRKELVLDVIGAKQQEGRKSVVRLEDKIAMSPQEKAVVQDIMERLQQAEAWNTFVAMGRPGWAGKQEMAVAPILDELQAASPEVYEIFDERLMKAKVEDFDDIKATWPKMRDELLRNGEDAMF